MTQRFVRRRVEDEEFWLDLEAGRFYGLNTTAAAVLEAWRDGVRTPGAIADRLAEAFEVPRADALAAVEAFLAEAGAKGMLAE